jgi:hypothetical protein
MSELAPEARQALSSIRAAQDVSITQAVSAALIEYARRLASVRTLQSDIDRFQASAPAGECREVVTEGSVIWITYGPRAGNGVVDGSRATRYEVRPDRGRVRVTRSAAGQPLEESYFDLMTQCQVAQCVFAAISGGKDLSTVMGA